MEERGHAVLVSFLLSAGDKGETMAGAPAAVLSHETTQRKETADVKTTKQTEKGL